MDLEGNSIARQPQHPSPGTQVGPAPQAGSKGPLSHPLPWGLLPLWLSGEDMGTEATWTMWLVTALCARPPNQGPSTPLSQPQHMSTHLVGVSLEDRGEGGHGTLPPASEHGGADQGPPLRSGEQSQTPAPGLQSSPPDPPKLTSSRTRVRSGVLRVFRGPSLPGTGTAGTSLAGGRQRVSSAAGLGGCGDPLPHTHRLGAAGSWHSSAGSPEK